MNRSLRRDLGGFVDWLYMHAITCSSYFCLGAYFSCRFLYIYSISLFLYLFNLSFN